VVRVGHPARLVEAVLGVSLDAQLARCDSAAILRDVKQELELALVGGVLVGGAAKLGLVGVASYREMNFS